MPYERIIELAFELDDPTAINRSLIQMAEYVTVSLVKDQSLALGNAIAKEIEPRDDIPEETKLQIRDWLDARP